MVNPYPVLPNDIKEKGYKDLNELSRSVYSIFKYLKNLSTSGAYVPPDTEIEEIGLVNNTYGTAWTPTLKYYDVDDDAEYDFCAYDSHGILTLIKDPDTLEMFIKVEGSIALLANPYRVEDGSPEDDDVQTGSYCFVPLPVLAYLTGAPYFTGTLSGMFISPATVGEGVNNFLCGVVGDDGIANGRCRLFYSYTDTGTGNNYAKGILPSYMEDNTSFNFTLMYPIGNADIPGQPDGLEELGEWIAEKRALTANALKLSSMTPACIASFTGSGMGSHYLDEAAKQIYFVDNNGTTEIRVYSYRDLYHLNESLTLIDSIDMEAIDPLFDTIDSITGVGDGINFYIRSSADMHHVVLSTAHDFNTATIVATLTNTDWTTSPPGVVNWSTVVDIQYSEGYLYLAYQRINNSGDIYYFTRASTSFSIPIRNIATLPSTDYRPSTGYLFPAPTAGNKPQWIAKHPITGMWWGNCTSSGLDTFRVFPYGSAEIESINVADVPLLTGSFSPKGMQFNATGSVLLMPNEDSSGILERAFYLFANTSVLPDLYWPEVTSLLDMEDAVTPTDKSGYTHTIALVGTASLTTAEKKFDTKSLAIPNANTQGLSLVPGTELAFGTGDFTIEFWHKRGSSYAANAYVLDFRPAGTNGNYITLYFDTSESIRFFTNSADRINGSTVTSASVFTHIALCRESGTTRLFIDGAQDGGDYADTNNYLSGSSLRIGHSNFGSLASAYGWLDSLRITKGIARYTANFTPGINPMPQVGQE